MIAQQKPEPIKTSKYSLTLLKAGVNEKKERNVCTTDLRPSKYQGFQSEAGASNSSIFGMPRFFSFTLKSV
jgi:hypothetical protein